MKKTIAITAIALGSIIGATSAMADSNIYTSGYMGWERTALENTN